MLRDESLKQWLSRRQTLLWLHCCHLTPGPGDLEKASESTKSGLFWKRKDLSPHIPAIIHVTAFGRDSATCTVPGKGAFRMRVMLTDPKAHQPEAHDRSPLHVFTLVVQSVCRLTLPLHFTFSILLIICNTSFGETYTQLDQTASWKNIIPIWQGAWSPKSDGKFGPALSMGPPPPQPRLLRLMFVLPIQVLRWGTQSVPQPTLLTHTHVGTGISSTLAAAPNATPTRLQWHSEHSRLPEAGPILATTRNKAAFHGA